MKELLPAVPTRFDRASREREEPKPYDPLTAFDDDHGTFTVGPSDANTVGEVLATGEWIQANEDDVQGLIASR